MSRPLLLDLFCCAGTGHGVPSVHYYGEGLHGPEFGRLARIAMGIDWMTRDELAQAIPPAYCEFIGKHLLAHL
jgi:hypothetical protein